MLKEIPKKTLKLKSVQNLFLPEIRLKDLGLRIAGQRSLRKINPDTALVFTKRSFGHFCITFLCRQ